MKNISEYLSVEKAVVFSKFGVKYAAVRFFNFCKLPVTEIEIVVRQSDRKGNDLGSFTCISTVENGDGKFIWAGKRELDSACTSVDVTLISFKTDSYLYLRQGDDVSVTFVPKGDASENNRRDVTADEGQTLSFARGSAKVILVCLDLFCFFTAILLVILF